MTGAEVCCITEAFILRQVLGRTPYGADWYVLGNSLNSYAAANASNNGDDLFTANYQGASYTPRLLDYGSGKQPSLYSLSSQHRFSHSLLVTCISSRRPRGWTLQSCQSTTTFHKESITNKLS